MTKPHRPYPTPPKTWLGHWDTNLSKLGTYHIHKNSKVKNFTPHTKYVGKIISSIISWCPKIQFLWGLDSLEFKSTTRTTQPKHITEIRFVHRFVHIIALQTTTSVKPSVQFRPGCSIFFLYVQNLFRIISFPTIQIGMLLIRPFAYKSPRCL